jgi:hypothetical protein
MINKGMSQRLGEKLAPVPLRPGTESNLPGEKRVQTVGSWVRIPLEALISVFILCLSCSLYVRPCDGLMPRPRSPTCCLYDL